MTTKHTPGPWEWRDPDDLRQAKSTRDDGRYGEIVLCASNDYDRGPYLETTDANRAIIAAAPDLLEALEAAIRDHDDIDDGRLSGNTVATIRAAIAKAKP